MDKKRFYIAFVFLMTTLCVPVATGLVYYFLSGTLYTTTSQPATVIFTAGYDTSSIGGSITANGSAFLCTIPIYASVGVFIDEAVNITNTDSSSHSITLMLDQENFTSDVKNVSIWMVKPDGTKYLSIELDDSGSATTSQSSTVTIPANTDFAVKVYIEMDDDDATDDSYMLSFFVKVVV